MLNVTLSSYFISFTILLSLYKLSLSPGSRLRGGQGAGFMQSQRVLVSRMEFRAETCLLFLNEECTFDHGSESQAKPTMLQYGEWVEEKR